MSQTALLLNKQWLNQSRMILMFVINVLKTDPSSAFKLPIGKSSTEYAWTIFKKPQINSNFQNFDIY